MIAEKHINWAVLALLLAIPIISQVVDQPFTIPLATKAAILALDAVGPTLAL